MEWNDGPLGYYSDSTYNNYEGARDVVEIYKRRTWKSLDY